MKPETIFKPDQNLMREPKRKKQTVVQVVQIAVPNDYSIYALRSDGRIF
jgi:hypothetical protein